MGDIKPVDQKHPSLTSNVQGHVLKDTTNEPARMGSLGLPKEDKRRMNTPSKLLLLCFQILNRKQSRLEQRQILTFEQVLYQYTYGCFKPACCGSKENCLTIVCCQKRRRQLMQHAVTFYILIKRKRSLSYPMRFHS